jgi:hypothetical protein
MMGGTPSKPGLFGFTEVVAPAKDDMNGPIRRQRAYKDKLRNTSLGNAKTLYETWQCVLLPKSRTRPVRIASSSTPHASPCHSRLVACRLGLKSAPQNPALVSSCTAALGLARPSHTQRAARRSPHS